MAMELRKMSIDYERRRMQLQVYFGKFVICAFHFCYCFYSYLHFLYSYYILIRLSILLLF